MNADNAARLLDQLAQRFGATGAALWSAYWHATQFYAASCLVVWAVFGAILLKACWQLEVDDDMFQWLPYAGRFFGLLVLAAAITFNLTDIIIPQGAALHTLLGK